MDVVAKLCHTSTMDGLSDFVYDADEGCVMRVVSQGVPCVPRRCATKHWTGYRFISVRAKTFLEHRVVWMLCKGPIPPDRMIDHIDGDRANNRIENLRLVTPLQNTVHANHHSDARNRLRGVSYRGPRWVARITFDGKARELGSFKTEMEARLAYLRKSIELHGAEYTRMTDEERVALGLDQTLHE